MQTSTGECVHVCNLREQKKINSSYFAVSMSYHNQKYRNGCFIRDPYSVPILNIFYFSLYVS